jgi:hypothetical protein
MESVIEGLRAERKLWEQELAQQGKNKRQKNQHNKLYDKWSRNHAIC